jgi:hypothetical protein
MGSVTCERCGFVSFATSEVCKQCGGPLPGPAAARNWRPQPQPGWQPQAAAADWQPQQQSHAGNWPPPPAQDWPPPPHGNSGYYQSQPGYYAVDDGQPKRKGLAVVAMLCGLLALPVMIVGAVAAVSLGAPAMVLGAVVGLLMTILSLTLGIAGTVRVNRNPAEFGGKGMAIAGIVLGSLLLVGIVPVSIISAVAIPNLLASRRAANEAAAVGALRKISAAQATYLATAGGNESFGSMDELVQNALLEPKMAEGTYCGYRFELETDGASFAATAVPADYPNSGMRSFYMSEDAVIHAADKMGAAADADDPEINSDRLAGPPMSADGEEDIEWTDNGPVLRRTGSQSRVRR